MLFEYRRVNVFLAYNQRKYLRFESGGKTALILPTVIGSGLHVDIVSTCVKRTYLNVFVIGNRKIVYVFGYGTYGNFKLVFKRSILVFLNGTPYDYVLSLPDHILRAVISAVPADFLFVFLAVFVVVIEFNV